jgi:hypothetical protein
VQFVGQQWQQHGGKEGMRGANVENRIIVLFDIITRRLSSGVFFKENWNE